MGLNWPIPLRARPPASPSAEISRQQLFGLALGIVRKYRTPRMAWYGPSTSSAMRASIIHLGAFLFAGALSACATSGGMGMTGRGGSGFESVSSPERIDACAGG